MHRLIYSATAASIAFATVMFLPKTSYVSAYDAPQDIHLSIETKEIDIDEIPENRVISLDIYTENCPPYLMLSFLLEKDERLEYLPYTYLSNAEQVQNMSGMSFDLGSSETSDVVMCNIPALMNEKIDYNGLLVRANVILPDDAEAGDFYSLDFRKKFSDTYEMETSIVLENDFDAVFGCESFSQLNGGGILITSSENSEPEVHSEIKSSEDIPEERLSDETENTKSDIQAETEITEDIPPEINAAEATAENISDVSEFSESTELQITSSAPDTVISEQKKNDVSVSDTEIPVTSKSTGKNNKHDKKNTGKSLMIAVSAAALAAAGIIIFIKKNKQK